MLGLLVVAVYYDAWNDRTVILIDHFNLHFNRDAATKIIYWKFIGAYGGVNWVISNITLGYLQINTL